MTEKIHVEFCADLYGDASGDIYKMKREMDFRPSVGDRVYIWELSSDPFVIAHIVLDFPEDNDEHRNGITAWLKVPVLYDEVYKRLGIDRPWEQHDEQELKDFWQNYP